VPDWKRIKQLQAEKAELSRQFDVVRNECIRVVSGGEAGQPRLDDVATQLVTYLQQQIEMKEREIVGLLKRAQRASFR